MQLVSKIKQIGTDIVSPMLYDYLRCDSLILKAISVYNFNSINYEILGPVFDNDYGLMYSFKLQDCLDLEYDPARWLSL
jgi:hypothetical protein